MDGDVRLVGDAGTIKIAFGTTDLATAKARWSDIHAQVELMKVELAVPDHTTLARRRRTFDVRNHRWRRNDRVDIVINSSGVKFFSDGEWVGSGDTHTASAHWSRRPYPASYASTAGGSAPVHSKPSRTKPPFISKAPTAT